MNPQVDAYVETADKWPEQIAAVRPILLGCGLEEQIKWNKPCYTHDGKNILILQEMNDFLALMFFKGALLQDPEGVLREQGQNSRSARRIEVSSTGDVKRLTRTIKAYVDEAIGVEEAGLTVGPAPAPDLVPELKERLDAQPALKQAFEALTPGRQREYNLYFAGAKQSKTRVDRIEKYVPKILEGKGFRDR